MLSRLNNAEVRVWLTRTNARPINELLALLEPTLSDSERARLGKILSPRRRKEYLMARALMRHALGSEHQEVWETLRFYETGARPEISSARKDIEFSLSHSRQLLCMAIGGSPVGIDCEWRGRKFRPELNEYLNSADDRAVLARLGQLAEDEHPVFSWCLREAWYKASAQHQKTAAAAIPLRRILDSGWQFQIFRISNHFGVIAAQQKFKVEALYCSPFRYELSLNTLEHDRIDHDKIVEATRP